MLTSFNALEDLVAAYPSYFVPAEVEFPDAEAEHAHLFDGVAAVVGEVVAGEV